MLVLVALVVGIVGTSSVRAQASAEVELRRIVQELLDAVAPGNVAVWQRYLHERVIHVDENGTVRTKAELLKEFEPLPPGLVGRIAVDTFKMETHGDVAIVAYEVQEHLDYHGQILRSRFRINDTWHKGGRAAHTSHFRARRAGQGRRLRRPARRRRRALVSEVVA